MLRLPLRLVLDEQTDRHRVPHETFCLEGIRSEDRTGNNTAALAAEEELRSFFRYLLSDDMRMPSHPLVAGFMRDAEDYESYTGEEAWTSKPQEADENAVPRFPLTIQRLDAALQRLGSGGDGVVLCGKWTVADDCPWAVSSRSSKLYTTRELLAVMKCSTKFARDLAAQHSEEGGSGTLELTLARAIGSGGCDEWRAFIPCRLHTEIKSTDGEAQQPQGLVLEPLFPQAAVCQRVTDACFPALQCWTAAQHLEQRQLVLQRVQKSKLLERFIETAGEADDPSHGNVPPWLSRMLLAAQGENKNGEEDGKQQQQPFMCMFSVDLLSASLSLPVFLLSAQLRIFPLLHQQGQEQPPDATSSLLLIEEQDAGDELEDMAALGGAQEDAGTGYWRLIRSATGWNSFSRSLEKEEGEGSERARGFCIVAGEANDLVGAEERARQQGLPLEFIHPEMLVQNPDMRAVFERWEEQQAAMSGAG